MSTEDTGLLEEFDAAFEGDNAKPEGAPVKAEDIKSPDEATAEQVAESELETESEPSTSAAEPDESGPEKVETVTPQEKTWKDLGFPEYENLSREDIAVQLKQRKKERDYLNDVYGRQANELGELRKQQVEKPKEPEEPDFPEMSEPELIAFKMAYEQNPAQALANYLTPHLEKMTERKIQEAVNAGFEGPLGKTLMKQTEQLELGHLMVVHPDAKDCMAEIKTLDSEKSLGPQRRPYEELYQLAQLWKNKDPYFNSVYALMAQHPTIAIQQAQSFALSERASSKEETDAELEQIEQENRDADKLNPKRTVKSAGAQTQVFSDIGEAWDSIQD